MTKVNAKWVGRSESGIGRHTWEINFSDLLMRIEIEFGFKLIEECNFDRLDFMCVTGCVFEIR
jgi:hypothetical protein